MIGVAAGHGRSWCRFSVCLQSAISSITPIIGKRGLEARIGLIERSSMLEPKIESLEAVRARLEREVRLLDARDPDSSRSIAPEVLGFVRPADRSLIARH